MQRDNPFSRGNISDSELKAGTDLNVPCMDRDRLPPMSQMGTISSTLQGPPLPDPACEVRVETVSEIWRWGRSKRGRCANLSQIVAQIFAQNCFFVLLFDVTPSAPDAVAMEQLEFSSLESQLTVDEHHTLRNTLRPTP